jgi:hypothetical protein
MKYESIIEFFKSGNFIHLNKDITSIKSFSDYLLFIINLDQETNLFLTSNYQHFISTITKNRKELRHVQNILFRAEKYIFNDIFIHFDVYFYNNEVPCNKTINGFIFDLKDIIDDLNKYCKHDVYNDFIFTTNYNNITKSLTTYDININYIYYITEFSYNYPFIFRLSKNIIFKNIPYIRSNNNSLNVLFKDSIKINGKIFNLNYTFDYKNSKSYIYYFKSTISPNKFLFCIILNEDVEDCKNNYYRLDIVYVHSFSLIDKININEIESYVEYLDKIDNDVNKNLFLNWISNKKHKYNLLKEIKEFSGIYIDFVYKNIDDNLFYFTIKNRRILFKNIIDFAFKKNNTFFLPDAEEKFKKIISNFYKSFKINFNFVKLTKINLKPSDIIIYNDDLVIIDFDQHNLLSINLNNYKNLAFKIFFKGIYFYKQNNIKFFLNDLFN